MLLMFTLLGRSPVNAINDEFPGFVHYRNWPGPLNAHVILGTPLSAVPAQSWPPITGYLSEGIAKDICAADPSCTWVHGQYAFGNFSRVHNSTYDMYLGVKDPHNETAPGATCVIEAGGANLPATKWLKCNPSYMYGDGHYKLHVANTYSVPPELIWQTCFDNPKCFGFRIKNDRSSGDILTHYENEPDTEWFKMP